MGDCDRSPCPAARLGDTVTVEFNPFRRQALGRERLEGVVTAITPFLHSLVVDDVFIGGHASLDEISVLHRSRR